jgi:hypothetical protein
MAGEIVTKSKRFYCVSIVPDFCRTPIGPNSPAIPYMIIGEFSEATGVSTNITSNGEPVVIHGSTVIPTVKGNEPGVGGGIKSNTVGGRVQAMEKSSTLSFNGERAVRVGDLVYMNDRNTIGKVFERLDPWSSKAFPKACEPGGTLAVLTEAMAARNFISCASLNFVPGGPSLVAADHTTLQSSGGVHEGLDPSLASDVGNRSTEVAEASFPANATDGGVSRGRGKGGRDRGVANLENANKPKQVAKNAVNNRVAAANSVFITNDPLCTMPPPAPSPAEIAARERIENGPRLQATAGDGFTPIERYLHSTDRLYQSPIGAGLYGVSKELGASDRTADHFLMLGYSVDTVGGAATGGGMLRGRVVQPARYEKFNTSVDSYINMGKQERHIFGGAGNIDKGYFRDPSDAQEVLNAYQRGATTVLGRGSDGGHIVRYDGITGYNVNKKAGFFDQPTNVFWIKGTASPSVVPKPPTFKGE